MLSKPMKKKIVQQPFYQHNQIVSTIGTGMVNIALQNGHIFGHGNKKQKRQEQTQLAPHQMTMIYNGQCRTKQFNEVVKIDWCAHALDKILPAN